MKLGVIVGTRYCRVGRQYYTYTSYHAQMWRECLEVFDQVVLLDKAYAREEIPAGQKPVLLDGVRFIEFPAARGLLGLLTAIPRMLLTARRVVRQADVWNLHAPDIGTFCLWFWARRYRVPYMLELRGDQSMTPRYLKLRRVKCPRLVARFMRLVMWLQRSGPLFELGVSHSLIRDFPPRNGCETLVLSDNRIPADWYGSPRTWNNRGAVRTIICVGRVEAQKNPLNTMEALARLNRSGYTDWRFVWAGDGPLRAETQELADRLGLTGQVDLKGFVPWDDVFGLLDSADLFLLNSISEGLPRAAVEAMARGLPVLATRVGGVPELLADEDILVPDDAEDLARKLRAVLPDDRRLEEMSRRNLETARAYAAESLSAKKIAFYRRLREAVELLGQDPPAAVG
ncbi:MAG: glycosyltransferase [Sedimentisphaerales bacterium]|nr:glycosyltransferase [Sedimentisphaerales bacterium]